MHSFYRRELRLAPGVVRAVGAGDTHPADLYGDLFRDLVEHLDAEEQRLLPIAARHISQEEWDRRGDVSRRSTPRREQSVIFGMLAYDGDPDAVALMLANAPPPVRWLVPPARRALR